MRPRLCAGKGAGAVARGDDGARREHGDTAGAVVDLRTVRLACDASQPYLAFVLLFREHNAMTSAQKLTVRLSTKGQVILPKSIRQRRHWDAGTRLVVEDTA